MFGLFSAISATQRTTTSFRPNVEGPSLYPYICSISLSSAAGHVAPRAQAAGCWENHWNCQNFTSSIKRASRGQQQAAPISQVEWNHFIRLRPWGHRTVSRYLLRPGYGHLTCNVLQEKVHLHSSSLHTPHLSIRVQGTTKLARYHYYCKIGRYLHPDPLNPLQYLFEMFLGHLSELSGINRQLSWFAPSVNW